MRTNDEPYSNSNRRGWNLCLYLESIEVTGPTLNGVGIGTYIVNVVSATCTDADTVNVIPANGVPVTDFTFQITVPELRFQFTDATTITGSNISGWVWDLVIQTLRHSKIRHTSMVQTEHTMSH
ncbi:MAG: hypothetical protein U0X76_04210 [Bacteroidia bacterium]